MIETQRDGFTKERSRQEDRAHNSEEKRRKSQSEKLIINGEIEVD